MSVAAVPLVDLGRDAGPLLIGAFLNCWSFGVLTVQVYLYNRAAFDDHKGIKALVYVVWILEVAQTILFAKSSFETFVTGFCDPTSMNIVGNTIWFSVPVLGGIVTFISHAFYAYRIRILGHDRPYLAIFIAMLAVIQVGTAAGLGVETFRAKLFSSLITVAVKVLVGLCNGSGAICDSLIAICMIYYLTASKSPLVETRILIRKLIRLIIETGLLTATVSVTNVVLVLLPGHTTYYQTSAAVLGKLYSNSILVLLNSRMKMESKDYDSTIPGSMIHFSKLEPFSVKGVNESGFMSSQTEASSGTV